MIRLLVVHKVRLMCELMGAALKEQPDMQVADFARCAEEAMAKVQQGNYNVVVVSINLPDNEALRLTRMIARTSKQTKVLVTGVVESKAAILRCIEEGAAGYILEEDSLQDLVKKIRAVCCDESLVSPSIASALILRLAELKRKVHEIRNIAAKESIEQPSELTAREWEIVRLIEKGLSNQQISEALVIELGTVKNHVHNILRKLNVQSRKHAVVFVRQVLLQERLSAKPNLDTGTPLTSANVAFASRSLGQRFNATQAALAR